MAGQRRHQVKICGNHNEARYLEVEINEFLQDGGKKLEDIKYQNWGDHEIGTEIFSAMIIYEEYDF